MVHGLRSQFAFAIGAVNPQNPRLREVDIFLAGIWLTCEDDYAFVPAFAYALERTIDWVLGNKFPSSPYPQLSPDELHRRLAIESDGGAGFLNWGPTTDNFKSFAYRDAQTVHITASFYNGRNHPRPEELNRVFHTESPERELLLILHRTACDLRHGLSDITFPAPDAIDPTNAVSSGHDPHDQSPL